jgi:hypothetical protein
MPRFFFDIRRENVVEPDHDGLHLPSAAVARAEAARAAVEMVKDAVPDDTPDIVIVVRDEHGRQLFEVEALVRVTTH